MTWHICKHNNIPPCPECNEIAREREKIPDGLEDWKPEPQTTYGDLMRFMGEIKRFDQKVIRLGADKYAAMFLEAASLQRWNPVDPITSYMRPQTLSLLGIEVRLDPSLDPMAFEFDY